MGFFDNFKKKEDNHLGKKDNSQMGMPIPPKAGSAPNENTQPMPPPPKMNVQQPSQRPIVPQQTEKKQKPGQPFTSPPKAEQPTPPQKQLPPKQANEPLFQPSPVTANPQHEMPKWPEKNTQPLQKNFEEERRKTQLPPELPKRLPELPNKPKRGELPKYKVREIPAFDIEPSIEMPVLEGLPVLDVEEKQEIYRNYRHKRIKKPLFIRTDNYKEVIETINNFKNYVDNSLEVVSSLENLKRNADLEHNNYKDSLEDIQRKLIYVDKALFGG